MGRNKISQKNFLNEAKGIFGEMYDFSISEYKGMKEKIKVICPEHGVFEIRPCDMIYKKEGCPLCRYEKMARSKSMTAQEFIKKARKIHGNKYDYSLVNYKNNKTPVEIICKIHGRFWQLPNNHLRGEGCPCCLFKKFNNSIQSHLI